MSFGVIRIQKVKRQGVTGIGIHHERKKERSNTNPDIDRTRTPENYYLEGGENVSFTAEVNRRLEGVSGSRWGTVRKDAVVLAEALITSDSAFFASLPPEKQKAFFAQSLDFLKKRYGEKNIFSAVVHMDETTPHLHVSFVPIKGGKLSAKTLFTRDTLSALQTDFFEEVGKQWGLQRGEKRVVKRKHIATPDFKRMTAEELDRLAIAPEDVKPYIKKTLLWTYEERPDYIAYRLTDKYIRPLVKELQALRQSEAQWKEEAQLKDEVFQEKRELERGLSPAGKERLKFWTHVKAAELRMEEEAEKRREQEQKQKREQEREEAQQKAKGRSRSRSR